MTTFQKRRHPIISRASAVAICDGGKRFHARAKVVALFLCFVSSPLTLFAHDIVAITATGRSVVLAQVEKNVTSLDITCRKSGITLSDPVVEIKGLAELKELHTLSFYYVPQISSYTFLRECSFLERLVISFGRVRSLDFLAALPNLKTFHLEFCGDWESELGLPFARKAIDLSANQTLEYLAFRICDLKRVPLFKGVPDSLKYIDLSYNSFAISEKDTDALDLLRNVDRVFLAGAGDPESIRTEYSNLAFEDSPSVQNEYLLR